MSNRKGRCPTATQLTTTNYQILTTVNRTCDNFPELPVHTVNRTCDMFPEPPVSHRKPDLRHVSRATVHTVDPGYDKFSELPIHTVNGTCDISPDYLFEP
jgi:hypothetical protein